MPWERPASIPVPRVWHQFQGADAGLTDNLVTYRVEDLTPNRYDDMVQHFLENYADDEPECVSKGVLRDELTKKELTGYWRWCFSRRMTLVCYKENCQTIVGGNLLNVRTREKDDVGNIHSEKLNGIFDSNDYMRNTCDIFNLYGVEEYLTGYGIAINEQYRGRGICREMLRARIPMCKAFGLTLTSTNFTSARAQVAAENVGFRCDLEMSYDDLAKLGPRYTFPGIKSKSTKVMNLLIE